MGVLPNQQIIALAKNNMRKPIFEPFYTKKQLFNGKSFGVSQCGYDVRCKQDLTIYPVTIWNLLLKALGFKRPSFVLASTLERFNIPNDIVAIVHDKSTWARLGLAVQNTVAEPGWEGWLTLELTNHGDEVIHIKAGEPIAQILLHWLDAPTVMPYDGKYQDQSDEPVPAKLERGIDPPPPNRDTNY